jgi:SAM-dependent methyltransferase
VPGGRSTARSNGVEVAAGRWLLFDRDRCILADVPGASNYDFGYPWWMTWGHLVPLVVFGLLAAIGWRRAWSTWIVAVSGTLAVWGLAGYLIVNRVLVTSLPLPPPTPRFLPDGSGRVVDLGAGSGRATLMVLQTRPKTTVVAVDLYSGYWGISENTPERLKRNAAAGGVANRVQVEVADMRELPFPDESFDAAVSSFAVDHLPRDGVAQALRETARVLKPGGQLLIVNLRADAWIRIAFPFPPGHAYLSRTQDAERWRLALADAGFEVEEQGTQPGAVYYLGRRKP